MEHEHRHVLNEHHWHVYERAGCPTSRIHTTIATPGWSTGTRTTRIRITGTGIKCKNRIIKGLCKRRSAVCLVRS
jgi:hypothetical protein